MIGIGRKMVALARKTYPENPSDSNCVASILDSPAMSAKAPLCEE
jgi:hypothetical protein